MKDHPYDYERGEMAPYIPMGASIVLDVGCSTGQFCALLKDRLPTGDVWGIEPHESAADAAIDRADRVIRGSFPEDLPENAPRFDAVFFNDVLEHMADPWKVLEQTRAFLSSTGRVVASIPNVRHWSVLKDLVMESDFSYEDEGIRDRTHLRFFTRSTMIDLFESTGYILEKCEPINIETFWKVRLLSWIVPHGFEIRALQYAIVAAPDDYH